MKTHLRPSCLLILLAGAWIGSAWADEAPRPDEAELRATITKSLGYLATEGDWLTVEDAALSRLLGRVRAEGMLAMNDTTLAQVLKRLKKTASAAKA